LPVLCTLAYRQPSASGQSCSILAERREIAGLQVGDSDCIFNGNDNPKWEKIAVMRFYLRINRCR